MEGKKVNVNLHTPIVVPVPGEGKKGTHEEAVLKIIGQVSELSEAGLRLEVSDFIGEKGQSYPPKHKLLFLPRHKIDHIYILS